MAYSDTWAIGTRVSGQVVDRKEWDAEIRTLKGLKTLETVESTNIN